MVITDERKKIIIALSLRTFSNIYIVVATLRDYMSSDDVISY